jgi:hypothetical protein
MIPLYTNFLTLNLSYVPHGIFHVYLTYKLEVIC